MPLRLPVLPLLILFTLLVSDAYASEESLKRGFEIFLLRDPAIEALDIPNGREDSTAEVSISANVHSATWGSVELAPEPILASNDVLGYDISSQALYLSDKGYKSILQPFLDKDRVPLRGKPFVVCADGKRCFLGAYMTGISSYSFTGPTISDMMCLGMTSKDADEMPVKIVFLEGGYPSLFSGNTDRRQGSCMLEVLERDGKIRKGLSGSLVETEFKSSTDSEGKPASTLFYTFEIHNESDKPLLFLDPEKTPDPFSYHRNSYIGVGSPTGERINWDINKSRFASKGVILEEQDLAAIKETFTELAPGAKVVRSTEIDGFPEKIPADSKVTVWYVMKPMAMLRKLKGNTEEAKEFWNNVWWGDLKLALKSEK